MRLRACINIMSGKIIQMFSHPINPSHCRYKSKLITAEVTTFHLVTRQSRESVRGQRCYWNYSIIDPFRMNTG